ncbi:unnamed protein product [Protopolystoma xenopodis]|uniref:Secreted protein n=1 Tax=Protopolystoma xenopodis TaxID=117903 RepID=A0A448X4Z0_9PLAT|nr:unnamed protein product [Protopolystoma xenopodis]
MVTHSIGALLLVLAICSSAFSLLALPALMFPLHFCSLCPRFLDSCFCIRGPDNACKLLFIYKRNLSYNYAYVII